MTLREKRYTDATKAIVRTIAQRDSCLANLVRYEAKLKALRKQAQRLERAIAEPQKEALKPTPKREVAAVTDIPVSEFPIADKLEVPDFLRRTKVANKTDAEVAATLRQEQADRKTAKARIRIDTMKAKQRGDTKRMPLSGSAALAAINEFVAQETK